MKNLILRFFLLLTVTSIISCNDNNSTVIDTEIDILIKNGKGEDMLNPATSGYYSASDFKMYYLIDGKKTLFFKANWEFQNGFYIKNENGIFFLRMLPNYHQDNEAVTYLETKIIRTDTIKTTIMPQRENNITVGNVWLNGNLVWSTSSQTRRQFEMVID